MSRPRLDHQPLFGKGARAPERAAEIEPRVDPDALMNTKRKIKKKKKLGHLYRRSVKTGYEGSRRLQCFVVPVLLNICVECFLDGKRDYSKTS